MTDYAIADTLQLKVGDWVMVRSKEEILSTLDSNARLEELPFMPQMLKYCGQRLQVRKRAHKMCDTAFGTGARKMSNAVILEDLRCDGQVFGGCEMRCVIIWKEAWLTRAHGSEAVRESASYAGYQNGTSQSDAARCTEADIVSGTRVKQDEKEAAEPTYVCQATQLPHATQPLRPWDIRQYIEDCRSGNAGISEILCSLFGLCYREVAESGLGIGSALRFLYEIVQKRRRGAPYPFRRGRVPEHQRTPCSSQNIQVGELIRVKSYEEILETVDEKLNNRGMTFHPEMVNQCGQTFRVSQRLRKIMNEKTGQLMVLKNECLILEGLECVGQYAKPIYCPRAAYPYWREVWLERVDNNQHTAT